MRNLNMGAVYDGLFGSPNDPDLSEEAEMLREQNPKLDQFDVYLSHGYSAHAAPPENPLFWDGWFPPNYGLAKPTVKPGKHHYRKGPSFSDERLRDDPMYSANYAPGVQFYAADWLDGAPAESIVDYVSNGGDMMPNWANFKPPAP